MAVVLTSVMVLGFGNMSAIADNAPQPAAATAQPAIAGGTATHNAIVLVLDNSGSMYGDPVNRLKAATKQFVDKIIAADPESQIALVAFSDDTNVQSFSNDKNTLDNFADQNLYGDSGTNVTAGLEKADELMTGLKDTPSLKYARSIVTMSDGWPDDSSSSTAKAQSMFASYNMYSVGFYPYQDNSASEFMKSIQNKGYYEANDLNALVDQFIKIVDRILNPLKIVLSSEQDKSGICTVTANITNPNLFPVKDVTATLGVDQNIVFGGQATIAIGEVESNHSISETWTGLAPKQDKTGTYTVTVNGHNVATISAQGKLIGLIGKGSIKNNNKLNFSSDTWAFDNYSQPRGYTLTDNDRLALYHDLDNTTIQKIRDYLSIDSNGNNDKESNGSCFGFAATSVLAKMHVVTPFARQSGVKSIHDMKQTPDTESYINYYWFSQLEKPFQDAIQKYTSKKNGQTDADLRKQQILDIMDKAEKVQHGGAPIVFSFGVDSVKFGFDSYEAHAVVADGYQKVNMTIDGHAFNGRVHIYDNNFKDMKDGKDAIYLYINDQTGDWLYSVPNTTSDFYQNANSFGTMFGFSLIKFGHEAFIQNAINDPSVWLAKDIDTSSADVKAEMIARTRTDNANATLKTGGNSWQIRQILRGSYPDMSSYQLSDTGSGASSDSHIVLPDKQSNYTVTSDGAYDYSLDYSDSLVSVESDKAASAEFSKEGDVSLTGSKGAYELSSTLNGLQKLYTYTVSGRDSSNVKLDKTDAGYVVSGDNLDNAEVTAEGTDATASLRLNTRKKKVLITSDGTNIKASIDNDDNGSYETVIGSSNGGGSNGNNQSGNGSNGSNGSNGGAHNGGTPTVPNKSNAGASNNGPGNVKKLLSNTGSNIKVFAFLGGALMLAGATIIVIVRRRSAK